MKEKLNILLIDDNMLFVNSFRLFINKNFEDKIANVYGVNNSLVPTKNKIDIVFVDLDKKYSEDMFISFSSSQIVGLTIHDLVNQKFIFNSSNIDTIIAKDEISYEKISTVLK